MRKLRLLILMALLLTTAGLAHAQEGSRVALLENDGKMATFSVEASAAKSGDVVATAIRHLFTTLLDDGVEDFFGGQRLMQKPNAKWRENFLKEKNPPYMTYVKGVQPEGEPLKTTLGDFRGTVLVRLNVEFLFRQLKVYGVMNK